MNEPLADARLEEVHGTGNCDICHLPKTGSGSPFCSYPHGMVPVERITEAGNMWSWKFPDAQANVVSGSSPTLSKEVNDE